MSSLKGLRQRESSKTESLLGNKDSSHARTVTTHRTNITLGNCVKMLVTLLIWSELILFIALWSLYVTKSQTAVLNDPIINKSNFIKLTTLQCYYWIQIIVQSTMIIFCMIFFIEFIIYIDRDWIAQVKKERDNAKLKQTFAAYRSESTDGFPIKHNKIKFGSKSAESVISYCNICSKLCSFKFCIGRIGAGIANIFSLTWSELHVLCMLSCIYYLLAAMLRLYNLNKSKQHQRFLFTISDILTGFGIILPPFAYNLCQKLKMIYDKNGSVSDITVAGEQWENKKSKGNWYQSTSQMSIVQASQSILNDKMIKFWMFIMFSFQFFIFFMEPIVAPNKFRYYLDSMYHCSYLNDNNICDSPTSLVVFTVHILIIRIAIPLLLLNTSFSFTPKASHTAQIMHYNYFYNIITPSSVIMIAIIEFGINYFLSNYYIYVTYIIVIIIILISLWQIYIFVRLLTLAEDAENDQEQFYGFAQRLNASLFNYFLKGIFYIILWFISFGGLLLSNSIPKTQIKIVYRQIASIIFAATSMFLLVPLQKIAISPTYRNYFSRKHRVKYLVTFHIICLFSLIFIIDKIIFISTFYYQLLWWNKNQMNDTTFRISFALSFASIGFFIWLFGKYCGILYPIIPKYGRKSANSKGSMTEMSEYKNNNNNNKSRSSKKRKDSKMSLTALYNIRHTPSIPLYDNQNELDNDFKQIDAIQPIKQQRTQSLSVKIVKSNSKKNDIGRNKSTDIQKTNSLSKFQNMKQQPQHSLYNHPIKYDDAAKRYGLKSDTISIDNHNNLDHEEEKYSQQ